MDISGIRERVAKLERLAQSTNSRAEAETALNMIRVLRKKYNLEPEKPKDIPREPAPQRVRQDFLFNNLKIGEYRQILAALEEVGAMPFSEKGEIVWDADIICSPVFLFFSTKRVNMRVAFASPSQLAVVEMASAFNERLKKKGRTATGI